MIVSERVITKLADKHDVCLHEVRECFANRTKGDVIDNSEEHKTDPPTRWFIAETDFGRELKIFYIHKDGDIHIKSAFKPNAKSKRIYENEAKAEY